MELDRLVPSSGNLWIAGQQVWLGPAMTGRTVRLWAGLKQVHVLLDGHRIKTLPSRLDARDLARLAAAGAQPAGPPPLPAASGDVTEVDRTVARPRPRGARPGTAQPPRLPAPLVVTRRVSVRGAIMVGGQRIQVGLAHARKTVAVTVEPGITVTAARTTSRDIRRHKASNYG